MVIATIRDTIRQSPTSSAWATQAAPASSPLVVGYPSLPLVAGFANNGLVGRSSYYKRSPRQGFMQRSYKQLKRLIRDLIHWTKRHPVKVFMLVIMPLITGGALTALLARFGLRLPPSLERMLGMASRAAGGGSFGAMSGAARMAGDYASGHHGGYGGYGHSSYGGGGRGGQGWEQSIMGVAKMFL